MSVKILTCQRKTESSILTELRQWQWQTTVSCEVASSARSERVFI